MVDTAERDTEECLMTSEPPGQPRPTPGILTNGDLIRRARAGRPSDDIFVVCSPPVCDQTERILTVTIDKGEPAAALDSRHGGHPRQPLVRDIANGDGSRWLLSGGMLILDDQDRVAVGVRDGNAADPFAFTNIAAGRCDQGFKAHCLEEGRTELILMVRNEGAWSQVDLGAGGLKLCDLNKPDVARAVQGILAEGAPGVLALDKRLLLPPRQRRQPLWTLKVVWAGATGKRVETARGLVWKGPQTIEFRRPVRLRLSGMEGNRIFFGEGTGYAEWWSHELLEKMALAEQVAGRRMITPFLKSLTCAEDLLLLLIPRDRTAEALWGYWGRVQSEIGRNGAHAYAPHATLVRRFQAEPERIQSLVDLLDEITTTRQDNIERPMVRPLPPVFTEERYHYLPLKAGDAAFIQGRFVEEALGMAGVGFMRAKQSIRVNFAYGFEPGQETALRDIAKECLGRLEPERWDLRLVREGGSGQETLSGWLV